MLKVAVLPSEMLGEHERTESPHILPLFAPVHAFGRQLRPRRAQPFDRRPEEGGRKGRFEH